MEIVVHKFEELTLNVPLMEEQHLKILINLNVRPTFALKVLSIYTCIEMFQSMMYSIYTSNFL